MAKAKIDRRIDYVVYGFLFLALATFAYKVATRPVCKRSHMGLCQESASVSTDSSGATVVHEGKYYDCEVCDEFE